MFMKIIRLLLLAVFLHVVSPVMLEAAEGALVLSVNPAVSSQIDGTRTTLAVKLTVPVDAVLISDAQGWAQLMFPDASTISISPDTELELAEFADTTTALAPVSTNPAAITSPIILAAAPEHDNNVSRSSISNASVQYQSTGMTGGVGTVSPGGSIRFDSFANRDSNWAANTKLWGSFSSPTQASINVTGTNHNASDIPLTKN